MDHNSKPSTIRTIGKKCLHLTFALAVGMPLAMGLGYLQEQNLKNEAVEWNDRLTNSQKAIIQAAADANECGLVHSRFGPLCNYVKRGEMTLKIDAAGENNQVATLYRKDQPKI